MLRFKIDLTGENLLRKIKFLSWENYLKFA